MAKAKLVQKQVIMNNEDIIKYQIITHCFINAISINDTGISCLALLAISGTMELSDFCNTVEDVGIFKTSQSVRNYLITADKLGLIIKEGSNKKTVRISDKLNLQTTGNIVLDYKMYYVEKES